MNFEVLHSNLTNPTLLFFLLGIVAALLRSDLEIPAPSVKFISLYLLFAIGFKGGQELCHGQPDAALPGILLFGVAISTVIPLYAFFLLRRRLYMEHLVVALHGHAFVCAMLLVSMGLSALRGGLGEAHALAAPIGWMEWAAMLWIPWGLWRQLRLIYRQRWYWALMTASVLAMAEMLLLSIVATAALLVSLVWL